MRSRKLSRHSLRILFATVALFAMTSGVRADEAEDLKAALQQLAQLLNGQLAKTFAASESESTPLRPATRQIGLGSPKLNVAASVQGTASGLTTTDAWRQMFPKK